MFIITYSYKMVPPKVALVVRLVDTQKKNLSLQWGIKWDIGIKCAEPSPINAEGTYGLSMLGGQYSFLYSPLIENQSPWLEQIQNTDMVFERVLADILLATIIKVQGEETEGDSKTIGKGNLKAVKRNGDIGHTEGTGKDINKESRIILVKGPAFPKLLGRLAYRRLNDWCGDYRVVFITYSRRFLSPLPFRPPKDFTTDKIIKGPFPSVHETAILRYFYCLPGREYIPASCQTPDQLLPLRLEVFCQNKSVGWAKNTTDIILSEFMIDKKSWAYYPKEEKDFATALIPTAIFYETQKTREILNQSLEVPEDEEQQMKIPLKPAARPSPKAESTNTQEVNFRTDLLRLLRDGGKLMEQACLKVYNEQIKHQPNNQGPKEIDANVFEELVKHSKISKIKEIHEKLSDQ